MNSPVRGLFDWFLCVDWGSLGSIDWNLNIVALEESCFSFELASGSTRIFAVVCLSVCVVLLLSCRVPLPTCPREKERAEGVPRAWSVPTRKTRQARGASGASRHVFRVLLPKFNCASARSREKEHAHLGNSAMARRISYQLDWQMKLVINEKWLGVSQIVGHSWVQFQYPVPRTPLIPESFRNFKT